MRVRQPGMDWPHRHLDRKAREEGQPEPILHRRIKVELHQRRDVRSARCCHHIHHRDQHQDRTEQRIEEEFVARLDPLDTAPDADDQVHRDQAGFEEDVKEEKVLRRKDADHERFHHQERSHIFRYTLLDRVPASQNTDRHQEDRKHDQHQRDAIYAQSPGEPPENWCIFDKLPLRAANFVIHPEQDTEDEQKGGGRQRHPPGALIRQEKTDRGSSDRQQDHQGKNGKAAHCTIIQVARPTRPSSITNA